MSEKKDNYSKRDRNLSTQVFFVGLLHN